MILEVYGQEPNSYNCIDSYREIENPALWRTCPVCKVKPMIWTFDNGCSTACCCGKNVYDGFRIKSESISSQYKRNAPLEEKIKSSEESLMENWNHWCETSEDLFEVQKLKMFEEGIKIW